MTSNKSSASAPARPVSKPCNKESDMKRVFAMLALLSAVVFGAPAWASDSAAPAGAPAVTAAAAPAAAADAAAPAAEAPANPPISKADNIWVMVSAALVILMSIPGLALFYGGLVQIGRASC